MAIGAGSPDSGRRYATAARLTRRAQQPYLDDLDRLGDTPFLADPKPWIEGTRVDLIGRPTP